MQVFYSYFSSCMLDFIWYIKYTMFKNYYKYEKTVLSILY